MSMNKKLLIFLLPILFWFSPSLAESHDKDNLIDEELPAVNPFLGGTGSSGVSSGDGLSTTGVNSSNNSVSLKNLKLSGIVIGSNKKFAIFSLPDGRTVKYKEDTIISSDLMILDIFNENIYLKMDQIEYSLDLNNNLVKVEG